MNQKPKEKTYNGQVQKVKRKRRAAKKHAKRKKESLAELLTIAIPLTIKVVSYLREIRKKTKTKTKTKKGKTPNVT